MNHGRSGPSELSAAGPDEDRRDEANARLRLVLDNTVDVIVQYDLEGTLLWAATSSWC